MTKTKAIVVLVIVGILLIFGTVFAFVSLDKGELGLNDYIAYPNNISLGLDLSGGVYAIYEASGDNTDNLDTRMDGTVQSLSDLLFDKGYTEATVERQGDDRIRVEVPDVSDPETLFAIIGKPASLAFRKESTKDALTEDSEPYVTGDDVEQAGVTYNNETGYYEVALKFTSEGSKKFSAATTECKGSTISIWINNEPVISPTVSDTISTGTASISGKYTYEQAYELATQIQAGAFDVELSLVESSTISPSLGKTALQSAVIAGLVGLALIIVYLCVLYRLLGVCGGIALCWYSITYIFFLSIFPWVQLTISGVAGVILSIGMAVDANIIIFSRIKDEFRNVGVSPIATGEKGDITGKFATDKSVHTAVKDGYRKSLSAILDGNITTILGCIVMLFVGGSAIKSFAITLMIGIVISLISSILVSRLLVSCMLAFTKSKPVLYSLSRGGTINE